MAELSALRDRLFRLEAGLDEQKARAETAEQDKDTLKALLTQLANEKRGAEVARQNLEDTLGQRVKKAESQSQASKKAAKRVKRQVKKAMKQSHSVLDRVVSAEATAGELPRDLVKHGEGLSEAPREDAALKEQMVRILDEMMKVQDAVAHKSGLMKVP
jgi:chromosome segregation ATPase